MNPAEFIRLAEKLSVQQAAVPAVLRTATSRAYYGAFHLTRQYFISLGFQPGASHDLPRWLSNCPHELGTKLGNFLSELQTQRIKADYRLVEPQFESPRFAQLAVERAIDVERLLGECQSAEARVEIAAHIKAFLAKRGEA